MPSCLPPTGQARDPPPPRSVVRRRIADLQRERERLYAGGGLADAEQAAGHLSTKEVGDLFEVFTEALLRTRFLDQIIWTSVERPIIRSRPLEPGLRRNQQTFVGVQRFADKLLRYVRSYEFAVSIRLGREAWIRREGEL